MTNPQTRKGHWTGYIPLSIPEGREEGGGNNNYDKSCAHYFQEDTHRKQWYHFWVNFLPRNLDISEPVLGNSDRYLIKGHATVDNSNRRSTKTCTIIMQQVLWWTLLSLQLAMMLQAPSYHPVSDSSNVIGWLDLMTVFIRLWGYPLMFPFPHSDPTRKILFTFYLKKKFWFSLLSQPWL